MGVLNGTIKKNYRQTSKTESLATEKKEERVRGSSQERMRKTRDENLASKVYVWVGSMRAHS